MTLELSGLAKAYAGFEFGPVDLSVGEEVLSVLGPSGSGKTTLLALIAGITDPDGGHVSLGDRRLDDRPIAERRTGLVFQDGALFPHMTARENVAYAAEDDDRIDDLAARLEIESVLDRRPPTLSGGEAQRVALARALAADPDALLLDEPLSSLDAPIRRRLRAELDTLFASLDVPVVYVTHDQRTATALGDRLAVLRDGAIEQIGSPSDVVERPETPFVARFTGTENLYDATIVERDGDGVWLRVGGLRLRATDARLNCSTVTACIHPSRVEVTAPTDNDAGAGAGTDTSADNALSVTVRRWLNEGTEYRLILDIDDAELAITATVSPQTFEQLGVESGVGLRVTVPPDAIHLIEREAASSTSAGHSS